MGPGRGTGKEAGVRQFAEPASDQPRVADRAERWNSIAGGLPRSFREDPGGSRTAVHAQRNPDGRRSAAQLREGCAGGGAGGLATANSRNSGIQEVEEGAGTGTVLHCSRIEGRTMSRTATSQRKTKKSYTLSPESVTFL